MEEILDIWSFWLTIEKVGSGFCYHAERVRFRLNFDAERRGKGISIALAIRSVDPRLRVRCYYRTCEWNEAPRPLFLCVICTAFRSTQPLYVCTKSNLEPV